MEEDLEGWKFIAFSSQSESWLIVDNISKEIAPKGT